MRELNKNKTTIYYALFGEDVPVLDDDGFETGETMSGYGNPKKLKINCSATKGETEELAFGISLEYDKALATCNKKLVIDEQTIFWIDVVPQIEADGFTKTKHDYKCVKVGKSLNSVLYAVKKVV